MDLTKGPPGSAGPTPSPGPVNSPEFRKLMIAQLKDMVKKGHVKLAPGNKILWTPGELAAMTPEERVRCTPAEPVE